MELSHRRTAASVTLGLLAGFLLACGAEAPQTSEPTPAAADAPAARAEPAPPAPEPVSLPANYPSDVPSLAGLDLVEAELLPIGSHKLVLAGSGDAAAVRVEFEKAVVEAGWEVAISEEIQGGRQQSILALKGKRSLSLMVESKDGGLRAELISDPEAG